MERRKTGRSGERAHQELRNPAGGLHVLEVDRLELNLAERQNRFNGKNNGDKLAALRWAILEEKRRNVRMLVNKVVVLNDKDRGERIVTQLAFDDPSDFPGLVYRYQSPAYAGRTGELA
jgi:hypothetical protein